VTRRTTFQAAFLLMGLIIWGYGQRVEDPTLRLIGIAFFAVAFLLRFFRRSETHAHGDEEQVDEHGESSDDTV
jgi:fatty acid desaturase